MGDHRIGSAGVGDPSAHRVAVVKKLSSEAEHSPEYRELLRSTVRETRHVVPETQLVTDWRQGATDGATLLLLLDEGHALLRRATIESMVRAIGRGLVHAAPWELSSMDLSGLSAPFTVGAFEDLEAEVLGDSADWTRRRAEARVSESVLLIDAGTPSPAALESWWRGETRLEALRLGLGEGAATGLSHEFIDYYGEIRADVLDHVPPAARTVLEVGCGRGVTGAVLKERLGVHVTGLELNPQVADSARQRLDAVIEGDVLEVEPPSRFDLVLALELFEHLTDNDAFLERASQWLEPDGEILLSVPNVGHWSVVEELLRGRFDYLPIGLLCTTHHRFFTERTLRDWIEAAGFFDYEIVAQTTDVPDRFHRLTGLRVDLDSLGTKGFWVRVRKAGRRGDASALRRRRVE